jgi:hypothetical protein
MIVFVDVLSGKEVCSDSYTTTEVCNGAIMVVESKKIVVGDEDVNTGANASTEGGDDDEKVESTKQTVINVVHSHELAKMDNLTKKDYQQIIKGYFKELKDFMDAKKFKALGLPADYKPSKDKNEVKAAEKAAYDKLKKDGQAAVDQINAQLDAFRNSFDPMMKWIQTEVLGSFTDWDFYLPHEGEVGKAMLIGAKYHGSELSPHFYYFKIGLEAQKF